MKASSCAKGTVETWKQRKYVVRPNVIGEHYWKPEVSKKRVVQGKTHRRLSKKASPVRSVAKSNSRLSPVRSSVKSSARLSSVRSVEKSNVHRSPVRSSVKSNARLSSVRSVAKSNIRLSPVRSQMVIDTSRGSMSRTPVSNVTLLPRDSSNGRRLPTSNGLNSIGKKKPCINFRWGRKPQRLEKLKKDRCR